MSNLPSVRSELKRLGYLDHRFERFLLQDALRPAGGPRTVGLLAVRVALLGGLILAAAGALALAGVNGVLSQSPFDLLPLFLHLYPPFALMALVGFLALAGLALLFLRASRSRRIETLAFGMSLVAVGALLAALAWTASDSWAEAPRWQMALLAAGLPLAAFALMKVIHPSLLALGVRWTQEAPRRRLFSRRWIGLAVVVGFALLVLPVVLSARQPAPPEPSALPMAAGEKVLLVGVDGVTPEDVEYLLSRRQILGLDGQTEHGGVLLSYRRERQTPASFWTSMATGLSPEAHGVVSLDSFQPLGARTPLARNGPLRAYWKWVSVPLGLAEYRPLLSSRRQAYTLWELAARGGRPSLALNWWSTYPATPGVGKVLAHGAFQLVLDDAPGATQPPELAADLRSWMQYWKEGDGRRHVIHTLGWEGLSAPETLDQAVLPDWVTRKVFAELNELESHQMQAVYLPALDLAADASELGDLAFNDLVRRELVAAGNMLFKGAVPYGTVAFVFDPGRRGGLEGRILLWRQDQVCQPLDGPVDPLAVASGLFRALGLPQSAELPEPTEACPWPEAPTQVDTYGIPAAAEGGVEMNEEYLDSLRALGYL